jgi:SAM-dependent methyltransferase
MSTTYQTHTPESDGTSDSLRKLERLRLPESMAGKSFLDIGCNEGFFCGVAASRGAARVVGLDIAQPALDFARAHYPSAAIEWLHQRWDDLPAGPFDVILWASGMHYEPDPARTLEKIADRLAPGGLLVLECGVVHGGAKEMVLVHRQSDSRWIPTEDFLTSHLLKRFVFRQVAPAEAPQGDPIRRAVYHCRRRQPLVLLVRGAAHHDKLTFARQLAPSASKLMSIDSFVYRILVAEHARGALGPFIKANFKDYDLTSLYDGIDRAGLTAEYASWIADAIAPSDEAVIIEGYITDAQAAALADQLGTRAVVWDAQRLEALAGAKPSPLAAPPADTAAPAAPAAPMSAAAGDPPQTDAEGAGRLQSLFDLSKTGIYTSVAGYSHARYSQYTEASRHIHDQILKILESFGIEYYLFAGSMVGYVRNRQMPKWMDDLDVIIFDQQVALFESRVIPYLERCGFMCWLPDGFLRGGYQLISLVQGDDRAMVEGYDRARTIPLAEGVNVPVPWAQVDVFYTTVSEEGFIRNISGWGLYNEKNIPVNWVRPGTFVEIEGRRQRVFSRWEDDIAREYGDVMNNIIVSTHGTTFLTAPDTPWDTVSAEFDRIVAETSRNLPPSLSAEAHAAFRPLPGNRATPGPADSFDAIVAEIVRTSAEEVKLAGGDQIFWVMDLKRLFPTLRIRVQAGDSIEAARAAHLRAFIDAVDFASEQVAAAYGEMTDHLRRALG